MTFAAPLWLIGLVPWAAVMLYLLTGRWREHRVPFVSLWTGPVTGPRPTRKLTAPPRAVAAALAAMLLALLAAAGPQLELAGRGRVPRVTVVIDRGATMSARGAASTRFSELADSVAAEIDRAQSSTRVDLRVVPPSRGADLRRMKDVPPTALDTGDALAAAVAELRDRPWPLVVVSDRPLPNGEGVIHATPEQRVFNAGIVRVSVRESPRPQVMVSVRNQTTLPAASIEVLTGDRAASVDVELPPAGGEPRDFFVDVPAVGRVVQVRLVVEDSFEADDRAWLVREGNWPRIEARTGLGAELARMVEVYGGSRPSTDASPRVAIVADAAQLVGEMRGVVISRPGPQTGGDGSLSGTAPELVPHPITRGLEGALTLRLGEAAPSPPAGWTPVVRAGGRVAVAVREAPARQVWVGFDSVDFARRPEFVVFWANVFDWLGGGGGAEYRAEAVGPLASAWRRVEAEDVRAEPGLWPGLYERKDDGALRAVNALDVKFPPASATGGNDWRRQLGQALARANRGLPLAPALLLAALLCMIATALCWGRRSHGSAAPPSPAPA